MSRPPALFWFRRDLRLSDNPALLAAVRDGDGAVAPVFVADPALLASVGPARAAYLRATLTALDESLGGRLIVRVGEPDMVLADVAREVGASSLFATADFTPAARRRDARVARALTVDGVATSFLDSPYVVVPGTVTTKSGTPARVFTPFRRAWDQYVRPEPLPPPSDVEWRGALSVRLDELSPLSGIKRPAYFGDLSNDVPSFDARVGEAGARATLISFAGEVARYGERRNLPGDEGTSRLSAHLHFGTIHPRQVLSVLSGSDPGSDVFRSEIAWREFYADVLWHRPESAWQNLQPAFARLRVDTDDRAVARFQSWARGETGYPLVDAGMRQLLTEGWMHNRARMVTASFLVKHLHLDWRWGAKWFLWRLIDGDVASNQHGWQWTAGTGTDPSPFHRIFNPTLQAERFDPEGRYVHRYVEELRDVAVPACLQPGGGEGLFSPAGYPAPMIDAAEERLDALARFAEVRERGSDTS